MLIDSHCHFDFEPFCDDPGYYLALSHQAGVEKIVIPAVGQRNWQAVRELAERFPGLYFGLGLHPLFSAEHDANALAQLESELAAEVGLREKKHSHCVAVGECGLDFAIADADQDQQISVFAAQLQLANRFELPVIMHCRKAFPELLRVLRQNTPIAGGVYHGFSGSYQQATQLIDLGIKIGVGGTITYRRANKTRNTIAALPLDALLLETDAPDMPVAGFQGEPNRPDRLVNVLHELAAIRTESEQIIKQVTSLTTAELFRIQV
ncbi:TatD family hydrolase [Photobacterium rosenbergii]|uniref:TatD family hydrolase n=1 Tax=Photobacterium rosenbergii TaxID=294936 RepID=A0ABU3ZQZ5_9GAMM|nr:TatD family hydrolase [Photobacterium rosenbergii]MDV5172548.1 TatD family hydrolase [Photobacterium rosenbergii]